MTPLMKVCGWSPSGEELPHHWSDPEFYGYRSCATGIPLRLRLRRCLACGAFRITSCGGDREVLEELLAFATPIPEHVGWCSPEQPACAEHAEMPPRRKRKARRAA